MAIISAGVIMNVFLGLACFVYAYGQGMDEIPAKIGVVKPSSPAYEAGLRPGDEIVAIDGRRDVNFGSMMLKVSLSGSRSEGGFRDRPSRPEGHDPNHDRAETRSQRRCAPDRGGPGDQPVLATPPVGKLGGVTPPPKPADFGLKPGDTLIAVGPEGTQDPEKVENVEAFKTLLAAHRRVPLVQVFEEARGGGAKRKAKAAKQEEIKVIAPLNHVVDLGIRLTIEPIASIQANSIAAKAGFQIGDRIIKVDGNADFDPMRLPELCFDRAEQTMSFVVERARHRWGEEGSDHRGHPDRTPYGLEAFPLAPLDVPGLGFAYPIRPKIASIDEGSPAQKAGLQVGDTLGKITLHPCRSGEGCPGRTHHLR